MNCLCLIVGIILLICGSITLICTGVLVYKPFNYGIDFVSTQCSIQQINKGNKQESCGDYCSETVDCLAFQVSYNDPRKTANILELFNQTGIVGYLSPDEASIKEYGWVGLYFRAKVN